MANFKKYKIEELAKEEPYALQIGPFGSKVKAENYVPVGVPYLRGVNVNSGRFHDDDFVFLTEEFADTLRPFWCADDDILFVHRGTIGRIGIIPKARKYDNYVLGNSMLKMSLDPKKAFPKFVYYWLCSPAGQQYILSRVSHTGVPAIVTPLTTLREASISLPPLPEQRAIARILGALDDKIELNRQMNATLEAMARALFRSWFVDFEPVAAKAAGRAPFAMSADLAALFPDRFTDSPLGPIPEGWNCVNVPDAFEINPPRSLKGDEPAPYLEMKQMPTSAAIPESWSYRQPGSGMRFTNGDTLVARITPCLENGKTAYVNFLEQDQIGWGSTEYIVLRSKPPLPLEFSYFLARDEDFRSFAIANMTGSSGPQRVPATSLVHHLLTIPDRTIAQFFGNLFEPKMTMIRQNVMENNTLAQLRDTLLPKLLSGEIRVADAEKIIELTV